MNKKLLFLIYIAAFFKQFVWAVFIPVWQFPDEQAHFAQVQNVAEQRTLSGFHGFSTSKEIELSQKLLGTFRDEMGNNYYTYHPEFNLPFSSEYSNYVVRTLGQVPIEDRTQMTLKEATAYPALYYIFVSLFYQLVHGESVLTRVIFVRLANIPLFVMTIYFAYLIFKKVFYSSVQLQTVALMSITFHPMFSFVSAGITSDNLYNLLCTVLIWLSIISFEKVSIVVMSMFGLFSLILTFINPQAKLMILTVGSSVLFVSSFSKQNRFWIWIGSIVVLLLASGGAIYNLFSGKQFLPDVSAFSTLNISFSTFLSHFKWTLVHTYREVIPWYWGVFRWLSMTYPRIVHRIINWHVLFAVIGVLFVFIRPFYRKLYGKVTLFLILINLLYFLGLMSFDYLFTQSRNYSFGIQGRYFFPLIASQMALISLGIYVLLPQRIKNVSLYILGLGVIILHIYAQWFVIDSYTISENLSQWFKELSLYKPEVITPLYLGGVYLLQMVSTIVLIWYFSKKSLKKQLLKL